MLNRINGLEAALKEAQSRLSAPSTPVPSRLETLLESILLGVQTLVDRTNATTATVDQNKDAKIRNDEYDDDDELDGDDNVVEEEEQFMTTPQGQRVSCPNII